MTKRKKEPEYDFRFIKLSNGDDILGQMPVEQDEDFYVRFPLRISTMFDPTLDEAVYVFTPWIPFTEQETVVINKLSVVTMTTIRDTVKDIYLKKLELFHRQSLQEVNIPIANPVSRQSDIFEAEPTNEELEEIKQEEERLKKLKPFLN